MSTDDLSVQPIKRRVGRPKKIKPEEETNETPVLKKKGRPSLGLTKEEKDIKYYESRRQWTKENPEYKKKTSDLYYNKNKMLITIIKNMLTDNVIVDKYKTMVEQLLNNNIMININ